MDWVLVYVIVSATGGVATSTINFPTQQACMAAVSAVSAPAEAAAQQARKGGVGVSSACINRGTGRP